MCLHRHPATRQKLGLTGTTDIYLSFRAAHYICSVLCAACCVLCALCGTYENTVAVAQHTSRGIRTRVLVVGRRYV